VDDSAITLARSKKLKEKERTKRTQRKEKEKKLKREKGTWARNGSLMKLQRNLHNNNEGNTTMSAVITS
jgi:muconolactone delta-isomerase